MIREEVKLRDSRVTFALRIPTTDESEGAIYGANDDVALVIEDLNLETLHT